MTIKQYTYGELNELRLTKGELFDSLKKDGAEFDYALPQEWLEQFSQWCAVNYPVVAYHLIRSTTVWLYANDSHFGKPLTCCVEVDTALNSWGKS